ncbi:MAG: hypothetical protein H7645_09920 [Candidatus Heimdallarchaeota archaeon]|nr:hypothetical protein [Candidatus Heimdallarchaeota archaeon]MCK4770645.1 hypothetical protein [Candidatus Heimdallarchaeota archaeon]
MDEINFDQYMEKSSFMLEKYRNNLDHLRKIIHNIENSFFLPIEMVEYFYSNKSEYYTWLQTQDSIISLEDAYNELVGSMLDAIAAPDEFNYFLKDQRIPVLQVIEPEEEGDELSEDDEELTV